MTRCQKQGFTQDQCHFLYAERQRQDADGAAAVAISLGAAMTFWEAYRQAALYALQALWWIARLAAVMAIIMWFWWHGWYVTFTVAVIVALAGALALQARDIQHWHQPSQK